MRTLIYKKSWSYTLQRALQSWRDRTRLILENPGRIVVLNATPKEVEEDIQHLSQYGGVGELPHQLILSLAFSLQRFQIAIHDHMLRLKYLEGELLDYMLISTDFDEIGGAPIDDETWYATQYTYHYIDSMQIWLYNELFEVLPVWAERVWEVIYKYEAETQPLVNYRNQIVLSS